MLSVSLFPFCHKDLTRRGLRREMKGFGVIRVEF